MARMSKIAETAAENLQEGNSALEEEGSLLVYSHGRRILNVYDWGETALDKTTPAKALEEAKNNSRTVCFTWYTPVRVHHPLFL